MIEIILAFLAGLAIGILSAALPRAFKKHPRKAAGVVTLNDAEYGIERFRVYRQSEYEPRFWRKMLQSLKNLKATRKEKS